MEKTALLTKEVHSKPSFEQQYNDTAVRNNTNCYSHALGATYPNLTLYRIGAISQKKPIDETYTSLEEELAKNEYKIALFVKKWANGEIADYHFWRFEDSIWTEKWKGRQMSIVQDFKRDKLDYFPWNFVGIYKIAR